MMIPWEAIIIPNYLFMAKFGLIDTFGALALPFGRALIVSAAEELPEFVFDPGNYPNLNCPISSVADCSPDDPSSNAVSQLAGV